MGERIQGESEDDAPPSIGPARLVDAFRYSLDGLASAWRTEGAFRQEVIAAAILLPIACLAPVASLERVVLIGSVLLVIVVELLNCAVEAAIDRISAERHPLSKRAKDTGSAAVLVAIVIAVIAWGVILVPHVLRALR